MSIINILTNTEAEMNQIIIQFFLLYERNKGLFFLIFFNLIFLVDLFILYGCGLWPSTVILCYYLIFHYKMCISYSVQF